jgi:hypothetical protein
VLPLVHVTAFPDGPSSVGNPELSMDTTVFGVGHVANHISMSRKISTNLHFLGVCYFGQKCWGIGMNCYEAKIPKRF